MAGSIRATGLGKRYRRYAQDRPRTLKEALLRGFFGTQPIDRFWALQGVDLAVEPGSMLGVIGHNGAGKSTLLRLLGGVMRPDEGHIETKGHVQGLLELNTGMHPELTGRENIIIGGVVAGLTRREVQSQLDAIVAFAELEAFIDSPVRTYSTGMRMRLGFAVAAHSRPDVLLIDEVLSVGDLAFQNKCLDRIRHFKTEGCAIVLISHDLGQVEALCDQGLWLKQGRVASRGSPKVLVGEYRSEMSRVTREKTPAAMPERVTSSGVLLRPHENRFGSLALEILDVRLLDEEGSPVTSIRSGEALTIEIGIGGSPGEEAPIVGVSFSREDHEEVIDVSTDADGVALPRPSGSDTVTLRLERIDLAPGEYAISVGLYHRSWDYAYDYHWAGYLLLVRSDRATGGILAPPRQWGFKAAASGQRDMSGLARDKAL